MKKSFVFAIALALPLLSAQGCEKEKVCKPYAVRHDSYQPDRWWLCNSDGTQEKSVQGPMPGVNPPPVKANSR